MAFLIVGVLLVVLKLADVGIFGELSWWWVLVPFGLTLLWWGFVDATGMTQRRAMDKMDQKKADRRARNLEALGMGPSRDRKARRAGAVDMPDTERRAAKDPTQAD